MSAPRAKPAMHRRRFFFTPDSVQGETAVLPPDQAHHLRDVLRLGPGEEVEIFDGRGRGFAGKVIRCLPEVVVGSLRPLETERPGPAVILAAALLKADRFEWLLEKATELGADLIVPLETRHGTVRIPENRLQERLERWRRIVREACRQCRRLGAPEVRPPTGLGAFVAEAKAWPDRLLFHEAAAASWSGELAGAGPAAVCVGPEGGWHESETAAAAEAGFRVLRLGPRILRAETAALAAVALVRFHLRS